jgi:catechol 2,3-dioxygenase-like lactoylglutathione lyase family enzyme
MIGYATLGSNDMPKALAFYDALLPVLGAGRVMGGEKFQAYGVDRPSLAVCVPFNGQPATAGNGSMVALAAENREAVDALHARALSLGGTDEGAPGLRGGDDSGFYAAYFRDLDGNKLCVFKFG